MVVRKRPKMADLLALQVSQCRERVLEGRLVCIDPASGSSSGVGWAEYVCGEYTRSGVVAPRRRTDPAAVRLRDIAAQVQALGLAGADLCVVERLRGSKVHPTLHWATGVLVVAVARDKHLEIPISCWKSISEGTEGYVKGDEADAIAMGTAIVMLAKGQPLPDRVFAQPRSPRVRRKGAAKPGKNRTRKRGGRRLGK